MHGFNTLEIQSALHQLRIEIDSLTRKQAEALKRSMYTAMSEDEARKYDEQQLRLTDLVTELTHRKGHR